MVSPDDVRRFALSLEGAEERDHHGFTSFRTRKIFATMPDEARLHVMLPEENALTVTAVQGDCCEELWWGKKLVGVSVSLAIADPQLVEELVRHAWSLCLPKKQRN